MLCSLTCACNSYDGSLNCCLGYYWNRIENRCTSKLKKNGIHIFANANLLLLHSL